MPETLTPNNQEAFDAFVKQYNLDPANNLANMSCLFALYETQRKQQEQIDKHQAILGPDVK